MFFVIKFLISLCTAGGFWLTFTALHSNYRNAWIFTIVYFVVIFIISSVFFSVFSMAGDTIFLCYCKSLYIGKKYMITDISKISVLDFEKNDGTSDKPYFMSPELRDLLDSRNKIPLSRMFLK